MDEYAAICRRAGFADVEIVDGTAPVMGGFLEHPGVVMRQRFPRAFARPAVARPGLRVGRMRHREASSVTPGVRLYPTVPQIGREAIGEDWIDGVRVPPGTNVNLLIWLAHRNPKVWEHPRTFDPERFTPERSANRPKFAYFPFGGGGRICIGSAFAMLEARLILATVAV